MATLAWLALDLSLKYKGDLLQLQYDVTSYRTTSERSNSYSPAILIQIQFAHSYKEIICAFHVSHISFIRFQKN